MKILREFLATKCAISDPCLVNLSLQRYDLSVATILELRAAQQSFEDAGYRFVNFSYAAKIADIELKRISGQLGF